MSVGHDAPVLKLVPAAAPTVVIRSLPGRLGTALIGLATAPVALTIGLADGPGDPCAPWPGPALAVPPEYLVGEGRHRTNRDAGTLIQAYAEQMRSRTGEAAVDTAPDAVVGVTSRLNRPVVVVGGVLAAMIAAVTVFL